MDYGEDFKLDSNGDLSFSLKRIETTTGSEKVEQDLRVILKTQKGEDVFNPDFGFDALKIVRNGYDKKLIDLEVRKALKQYPYLKSIDKVEVGDLDANRQVKITIEITTSEDQKISASVVV
jgi:phage baseplate assembly protein W